MECGKVNLKELLESGRCYELKETIYNLRLLAVSFNVLQKNGIAHCDIKPKT